MKAPSKYSQLPEARKEKARARASAQWAAMTPADREAYNARKRSRYANDPAVRAKRKALSQQYAEQNYDKLLAKRRTERGIKNATGEQRGGPCDICGREFEVLDLDHDKATGEIRGWLCRCCNLGLGKFRDDPAALERAAVYIRNSLDRPAGACNTQDAGLSQGLRAAPETGAEKAA